LLPRSCIRPAQGTCFVTMLAEAQHPPVNSRRQELANHRIRHVDVRGPRFETAGTSARSTAMGRTIAGSYRHRSVAALGMGSRIREPGLAHAEYDNSVTWPSDCASLRDQSTWEPMPGCRTARMSPGDPS
jgi:hypothetical protein